MREQLVHLVVWQVLDLASTAYGLGRGAVEAHPVGQVALAGGFGWLVLVKAVATAGAVLCAWILWRGTPLNRRQAVVGLQVGCCVMVVVVGWNAVVILSGP